MSLSESIDTWRTLYEAWTNSARSADLETALEQALVHVSDWELDQAVTITRWRAELERLRTFRTELDALAQELSLPATELYPVATTAQSLRIERGTGERNGKSSDYISLVPPPTLSDDERSRIARVLARHGYESTRQLIPGDAERPAQWKISWERWTPH